MCVPSCWKAESPRNNVWECEAEHATAGIIISAERASAGQQPCAWASGSGMGLWEGRKGRREGRLPYWASPRMVSRSNLLKSSGSNG